MNLTITYWDAWAVWFSGDEVAVDTRLGPWTILTWGRIGKIVSFVGGATVLLDLVGPDRIRRLANPFEKVNGHRRLFLKWLTGGTPWANATLMFMFISIAATSWTNMYYLVFSPTETALTVFFVSLTACALFWAPFLAIDFAGFLGARIADVLDAPKPAQLIRYLAALLLLVGFHLDLLAS